MSNRMKLWVWIILLCLILFYHSEIHEYFAAKRVSLIFWFSSLGDEGMIQELLFHQRMDHGRSQVLRAFGFVHLLTLSGMHLYCIQNLFFLHRIRSARIRFFLTILVEILFLITWALNDYRIGWLRSWICLEGRKILKFLGLKTSPYTVLLLLFLVEILFRLFGDQTIQSKLYSGEHYYLSVFASLWVIHQSGKNQFGVKEHIQMAFYSWLIVLPLDLIHHQRIAPYTMLFSLVTIPWITWVLYPSVILVYILSFFEAHQLLASWVEFLLLFHEKFILFLIQFFSEFGLLILLPAHAPAVTVLFLFFGLFLSFAPRWIKKPVILFLFLASLLIPRSHPHRLIQLDVKQGDSAILQKDGKNYIVDFGSKKVMSEIKWLEIMSEYQVDEVHGFILTHPDEDHRGGRESLKNWMTIGEENFCDSFHVRKKKVSKKNDSMLGVVCFFDTFVYINFGDADHKLEQKMAQKIPKDLWIRMKEKKIVLKVSHHGSRTSSSKEFLETIHPNYVLISSGKWNHFGHPTLEVLERLKQYEIFRTDQKGNLVFRRCLPKDLMTQTWSGACVH